MCTNCSHKYLILSPILTFLQFPYIGAFGPCSKSTYEDVIPGVITYADSEVSLGIRVDIEYEPAFL